MSHSNTTHERSSLLPSLTIVAKIVICFTIWLAYMLGLLAILILSYCNFAAETQVRFKISSAISFVSAASVMSLVLLQSHTLQMALQTGDAAWLDAVAFGCSTMAVALAAFVTAWQRRRFVAWRERLRDYRAPEF